MLSANATMGILVTGGSVTIWPSFEIRTLRGVPEDGPGSLLLESAIDDESSRGVIGTSGNEPVRWGCIREGVPLFTSFAGTAGEGSSSIVLSIPCCSCDVSAAGVSTKTGPRFFGVALMSNVLSSTGLADGGGDGGVYIG